jgi:hypothetical protein
LKFKTTLEDIRNTGKHKAIMNFETQISSERDRQLYREHPVLRVDFKYVFEREREEKKFNSSA